MFFIQIYVVCSAYPVIVIILKKKNKKNMIQNSYDKVTALSSTCLNIEGQIWKIGKGSERSDLFPAFISIYLEAM